MAKKSSRRLSEAERAERRQRDRERLQRAAQELLTSEGWQRWVRLRALFHSYSLLVRTRFVPFEGHAAWSMIWR